MKALDLLKSFIKHPQGMAVIVDEYGGTEGVVTLNDIVEEIISDAVPSGEQELYIEPLGEGRVIAAGRTRLDDLAELGFKLEADGVDTIGGLIFNRDRQHPARRRLLRNRQRLDPDPAQLAPGRRGGAAGQGPAGRRRERRQYDCAGPGVLPGRLVPVLGH